MIVTGASGMEIDFGGIPKIPRGGEVGMGYIVIRHT